MGQELACRLTHKRRTLAGKAFLETDYVLFRGEGERLKISFQELSGVKARNGILRLTFPSGPASLELGAAAENWARKILHPPSRLDKLGVKPEVKLAVEGDLEPHFLSEIASQIAGPREAADLLFFGAGKTAELERIPVLLKRLRPGGAIWIVYPKGVEAIREIEVIQSGRAAGLKDTKVARFSETHTALRFSFPVR